MYAPARGYVSMPLARNCSDTLSHGSRQAAVPISGNSESYLPDLDRVHMCMARAAGLGVPQDPQDLIEGAFPESWCRSHGGPLSAAFRC